MINRIKKNNEKQPTSFVDLVDNYSSPIKGWVKRQINVPVYLVNTISGVMTETLFPGLFTKRYVDKHSFCHISIYRGAMRSNITFFVPEEQKYENKLVDIKYGSLYCGNYELYLNQRDAAIRSKEILWVKKMKLDGEINMLDNLIEE